MWAKFLRLGVIDYVRGFVVAGIGGVLAIIVPIIKMLSLGQHVVFPSWHTIGMTALYAGCGYLVKNLFTNSNDQMFKLEPPAKPNP